MAGKQERQRRLARERHERRLVRQAQRQQAMRKVTAWVAGGVVLLIVALVVTLTVVHLGSKSASAQGTPSATPSVSATPSASATPNATPPATEPATHCDYVPSGTAARPVGGLPPATPDYKATYTATIKTNRGDIVIDLLNSKATCTVNSFVFLASKNFYNKTPCPRLSTSGGLYIIQCGDPTGTGAGGPGYAFYSENLAGATYPAGTVAMANSGEPYTNGSQFFLVYKDTTLAPNYTPFGRIVSGLSVLADVAKGGIGKPLNPAGGGPPKDKVTIESVVIKKT